MENINKAQNNAKQRAKQYALKGDCALALRLLDATFHIYMDCCSPAHVDSNGDPQVWKGGGQWSEHGDYIGSYESLPIVYVSIQRKHSEENVTDEMKNLFHNVFQGTPCYRDASFIKQ